MKLTEEKKRELREVKECCKVSLPEFTEKYSALDKIGKIAIYQDILDNEYQYDDDHEEDQKINEDVLLFLRKDKNIAKELLELMQSGDVSIKDENGNEYNVFNDDLSFQE